MSITQIYGRYVVFCDNCDDELTGYEDFEDAVRAKKSEGWKSQKVDGIWADLCPNCQELKIKAKGRV